MPDSALLRLSAAPQVARPFDAQWVGGMRSTNHLRQESGASAAFIALLRFEANAYRLRAWLIHAYDLLESDMPLAADKLRLLKEDVSEAADLARKLIDIYDNKGEPYVDRPTKRGK
jgi:hypothetical protein